MYRVPSKEEALVLQKRANLFVIHTRLRYFFKRLGLSGVTQVTVITVEGRKELQYITLSGVFRTDYACLAPELQSLMDGIPLDDSFVIDISVPLTFESVPLLVEDK